MMSPFDRIKKRDRFRYVCEWSFLLVFGAATIGLSFGLAVGVPLYIVGRIVNSLFM